VTGKVRPLYETLGAALADQARIKGEALALAFGARHSSYSEFDRRADQVARALIGLGMGPGTRIGVLGRNSDRYAELMFGAARADVVTLTFNWRLARPELEYIAGDARLQAIFFDPEFVEEARNLRRIDPGLLLVSLGDQGGSELGYERFCAAGSPDVAVPEVDPDSPTLLLYTSGTTGKPKGVLISHRALLINLAQLHISQGPGQTAHDDIVLLSPPLFHVGGLCILVGAVIFGLPTIVLAEAKVPEMVAAIEQYRITRAVIIPSLMPAIVEAALSGARLSSLRTILYGMSPVPEPVLLEMTKIWGCHFLQGYGMTEACGTVTTLAPGDHYAGSPHLIAAGRPLPDVEMEIRRLDGSRADIGEPGEIILKTPALAVGILQAGEVRPMPLNDGWYETGDVGYFDDRGYLFLRDRKKDMIISGGENIYSVEVESVLTDHPDVERVAIIGVPSDKWGEEVKAIIVPSPGASPDPAAIIAFARERLAGYKVPKSVDFVSELPVTSVGKIAKNVLRERYWEGRERRIN
jgi:acyl-CoA synthetase (AMP-forming)/AMP-acid ligase II